MWPIVQLDLSFDQTIAIIGLIVNIIQALVLPITIYLLVVQTRAMRIQTTALVEQSKEMTAQTRVFIDTIYSATFQSLYDAEAHLGELMMTYPEASRILLSPVPKSTSGLLTNASNVLQSAEPTLRERVRWLGTAMLDFFEHIWTQAKNKGLPPEVWEAWEDYMSKMLRETYLRFLWQTERVYYDPGFRRFVDTKISFVPEATDMPPLPRPPLERPAASENQQPQVARVLRAVTEEKHS
ncbi:MAG: hypothetical protein JOZ18_01490 [Chloroflexi bacterium]|nr:hypothetical protein [Chloroflexota bacterium]